MSNTLMACLVMAARAAALRKIWPPPSSIEPAVCGTGLGADAFHSIAIDAVAFHTIATWAAGSAAG
jgi:hypothetical protein